MSTAAILINGQPIAARPTVRKGLVEGVGFYALDDGTSIEYRCEEGAVKLAIKQLKTI